MASFVGLSSDVVRGNAKNVKCIHCHLNLTIEVLCIFNLLYDLMLDEPDGLKIFLVG